MKLKYLILAILLFAMPVYAGGGSTAMMIGGSGGGAATCTTAAQTQTGGGGSYIFGDETYYRASVQFITPGPGYTLCKVDLWLTKAGSPGGTVYFDLYTDNGSTNIPNTLIETSAVTIATADVATDPTYTKVTPTFNQVLSATTLYHIVFRNSQLNADTNHLLLKRNASGTKMTCRYASSWQGVDASSEAEMITYKAE